MADRIEVSIVSDTISPRLEAWKIVLESPAAKKILAKAAWIIAARATEILKEKEHWITGTLGRSVHVGNSGIKNAVKRIGRDILETEVGSWIEYARKIEDLPDGGYVWQAFEEKFKEVIGYIEREFKKLLKL